MKYYFPIILIAVFSISLLIITAFFDEDDPEVQENTAFDQIEIRDIPVLNSEMAGKLALLPISCIKKEYPNKPGHVHENESSVVSHSLKTPIFSGCFDWHSAVHMHWTLIRLMRMFPDLKQKEQIISLMNEQFTEEKVGTELAFFNSKYNETFERTYGWAWLLRLQSELILLNDDNGRIWAQTLSPLVKVIRDRSIEYFNKLPKPVRPGTHSNTAFSMDHMLKYAKIAKDREFEELIKKRAVDFFLKDKDCPTDYEPSGVDFISPCLAQAHLMAQVLEKDKFFNWFNEFLKNPGSYEFSFILNPPEITDHTDYVIGHLVGLNFQRAWAYIGISDVLDKSDYRKELFRSIAATHLHSGLQGMDKTGYGGEHWLASFAVYAMTAE
ncbi:MAG TPA: DUF2891 domain-containing protein [bacterium]|nr:DUF2891 domain-containing protein [bacterium]